MKKYIVLDIETTGLNPLDGQVTCICMKNEQGYTHRGYVGEGNFQEKDLIRNCSDWIKEQMPTTLITKNGKQFDIPFMIVRCPSEGQFLMGIPQIDLQEITTGRVRLCDMATLMGVENKSGDGKNAIKLFHNKQYDELVKYCGQDVEVTEQVYLKWLQLTKGENDDEN